MFFLSTPYGRQYNINDKGEIYRPGHGQEPSGCWIMLGIIPVNCSHLCHMIPLAEIKPDEIEWTYQNGNPRFTVVDKDHGTTRVWGNTKYHGIKSFHIVR